MIDVQVILSGREEPGWLRECLDSLSAEPVRVHFGRAIPGDVSAARCAVWDRCGGEFISFVDPDDVVRPGAFAACLETLQYHAEAGGCCTWEDVIRADGSPICRPRPALTRQALLADPKTAHHLLVVRRRVYESVRVLAPRALHWGLAIGAFYLGGLVRVPMAGYSWRLHDGNYSYSNPFHRSFGADFARVLEQP